MGHYEKRDVGGAEDVTRAATVYLAGVASLWLLFAVGALIVIIKALP